MRLLTTLTAFCLAAGALLAWTNAVTEAPVRAAARAELLDALRQVLPPCDNDVVANAVTFEEGGRVWTCYTARLQGAFAGTAFESEAPGYGGPIRVLVGVKADDTVAAVVVLRADQETPGLGAKVRDDAFLGQFQDRKATDLRWAAVKKDGGELDAVTGATISSRAAARAVSAGLEAYAKHAAEIRGAGTPGGAP
jgi:electron transport complex protein RnfG